MSSNIIFHFYLTLSHLCAFFSLSLLFQYSWHTTWHYISLRCTTQWFNKVTYDALLATSIAPICPHASLLPFHWSCSFMGLFSSTKWKALRGKGRFTFWFPFSLGDLHSTIAKRHSVNPLYMNRLISQSQKCVLIPNLFYIHSLHAPFSGVARGLKFKIK